MAKVNDQRHCQACGARLARDNDSAMCRPCQSADDFAPAAAMSEMPPTFWEQADLQAALSARHMGHVIRAYRQHPQHGRRGLSQDEIATRAGITQGQLSRIENGPPIDHLDRLIFWAQLLGIPEEHLWFKLPDDQPTGNDGHPSPAPRTAPDLLPQPPAILSWYRHDAGHSITPDPDDDPFIAERAAALGIDLWELHDVLQASRVSHATLALAEESCARLDAHYAELPPMVLLPELRKQLKHVVGWLRESQPVAYRQRLCSLAGRLAGLRAWLFFDMAEYEAADAWFSGAVGAAKEAEDRDLSGWLLGAQSLIPVDRQDFPAAARIIEEAQALACSAASPTTRAWLHVLEARALAGLGDSRGFAAAQQRANKRLGGTSLDERRHGMDFAGQHLDLTYYEGLSHLLLEQPEAAGEAFETSLGNLAMSRVKARAVLMLSVALAAARAQQLDKAVAKAAEALTIAEEQPIKRVWQRAEAVRQTIGPLSTDVAVQKLDDRLATFAARLEHASSGPRT